MTHFSCPHQLLKDISTIVAGMAVIWALRYLGGRL